MTPRSLVGMTMGARRRRLRRESAILRANLPYLDDINVKLMFDPTVAFRRLRPLVDLQESYQLGQRLRPCPGCHGCRPGEKGWHIDKVRGRFTASPVAWCCDGSGVIPAKARKVRR